MARPSEFDRRQAVDAAMRQIWHDGYEQASVKHLSEQLGITRSSFYNAFGTREDLFREAIVAYQALLPRFPKARGTDERILPRLTSYFRAHCAFHAENGWRGCLDNLRRKSCRKDATADVIHVLLEMEFTDD